MVLILIVVDNRLAQLGQLGLAWNKASLNPYCCGQ